MNNISILSLIVLNENFELFNLLYLFWVGLLLLVLSISSILLFLLLLSFVYIVQFIKSPEFRNPIKNFIDDYCDSFIGVDENI